MQISARQTEEANAQAKSRVREMAWIWFGLGAIFGLLAVLGGAAGSHVLRNTIDADALDTFGTGVQFHMYHALALLGVGLMAARWKNVELLTWTGWLFVAGIVSFSGALYLFAITDISIFGAIAPIGGFALIAAWGCLAAAAFKIRTLQNGESDD